MKKTKKMVSMVFLFLMSAGLCFIMLGNTSNYEVKDADTNQECARAVTAVSQTAYYTLRDSELYKNGDVVNNCYTFAIEKEENDEAMNPGEYSGLIYDLETATAESLSQLIKQDLQTLGCKNVSVANSCPDMYTANKKLICVRKGYDSTLDKYDYHIMKCYNGVWYHKPGQTAILKYKYQPSVNVNWINEFVNSYGSANYTNMVYSGDIYYISYYPETYNIDSASCEIETYAQLKYAMKYHTASNFNLKLIANISAPTILSSDSTTEIIYKQWVSAETFYGIFDGNGYAIQKLNIEPNKDVYEDEYPYVGFISVNQGTIKRLTIKDVNFSIMPANTLLSAVEPNFDEYLYIGAIAGINNGTIESCTVGDSYNYSQVSIRSRYIVKAGGICGINNNMVKDCNSNYVGISAFGECGLVVGENNGNVTGCGANGTVSLYYGEGGAIAGVNSGLISECTVNASNISCYNGYPSVYSNFYPTNTHYGRVGGISGRNENGIIRLNTLYSTTVTSNNASVEGVSGRTFAPEMGKYAVVRKKTG